VIVVWKRILTIALGVPCPTILPWRSPANSFAAVPLLTELLTSVIWVDTSGLQAGRGHAREVRVEHEVLGARRVGRAVEDEALFTDDLDEFAAAAPNRPDATRPREHPARRAVFRASGPTP
jgi:hypothetical protein